MNAITMIGATIWRIDTPHARIAVISLSAESLPKTSMTDTSAAQGIVNASTIGSTYSRKMNAFLTGTPLEIYSKTYMR